jgi:hypothetical protein
MIVCKIDKISEEEQLKFEQLCALYPAKVLMRGNQLMITDKLLKKQDILAIGAFIANEASQ